MEKLKKSSRERKKRQKKKAIDKRMKLQQTYDASKKELEREKKISRVFQR